MVLSSGLLTSESSDSSMPLPLYGPYSHPVTLFSLAALALNCSSQVPANSNFKVFNLSIHYRRRWPPYSGSPPPSSLPHVARSFFPARSNAVSSPASISNPTTPIAPRRSSLSNLPSSSSPLIAWSSSTRHPLLLARSLSLLSLRHILLRSRCLFVPCSPLLASASRHCNHSLFSFNIYSRIYSWTLGRHAVLLSMVCESRLRTRLHFL